MPRVLETHARPPSELPCTRLCPGKTSSSNIQAQAPPQKPLTVAEQERLLRVGLPTELWKEVIRHATSVEHEFETCGFDGRNYTFEYSASYEAEWYQAFQTRLSLILVCKFWNNLASEYLYRSILSTHRRFLQLVRLLVNNGMIKYVQRVSVYSLHLSNVPKSHFLAAIAQFPNLRVLKFQIYGVFIPKANQTHITTLCISMVWWSAFETLAFLPHLQHLHISLASIESISSRVKLSQLKSLHVGNHRSNFLFYEWLDLPNLHTLILNYHNLPMIQHFLPHIRVLGLREITFPDSPDSMYQPPPNNPSAPLLRSIICREPFGSCWRNLPHVAPLKAIEEVHLSLEAVMLSRSIAERAHYHLYGPDNHLASLLTHMEDKSVMQKLSHVYTDLTTNTLRVMKPELKDQLRKWLTIMKKREVMVITYIKTSKYADHKYCSLEEAWDAEPHWEFWAPAGVADEIRKWDLLADATGRNDMTWKATKDGSKCQWFGEA